MAKSFESIIQSRIDNYMNEPFGITRFLFEKNLFDKLDAKMTSLSLNDCHTIEFNQGPTKIERNYIKYMIEKYNCSYGFIGNCSYLMYIPNDNLRDQYNKILDDCTDKFMETYYSNTEHIYYK